MAREAMEVCLHVLKESNKRSFDSYSVWNSVLIISHISFGIVGYTFLPTTFLEIAVNVLIFAQKNAEIFKINSFSVYNYIMISL